MAKDGLRVGSAYVELEADASGLEADAKAKVEAATAGVKAGVGLTINEAGFREKIAAAARGAGAGDEVKVALGVDGGHLREEVSAAVGAAGVGEDIKIRVDVDADDAAAKLVILDEKIKVVDASGNVLTQHADGSWRNALGWFVSDADKAAAGIEGLGRSFDPARESGDAFEREFRAAMGEAEQVSRDADQALTKSFSDIEKASRSVRASMSDVAESADTAGNKTRDAGDKAADAGKKAAGSGGGFMGMSGSIWALVGAAGALGPALAALPALLGGGGLAALTLGGAFSSVASTMKDHVAATNAVGQSGASLAATEFSNSVAIRNAQQAITDARKQAATAAVTSAQQIKDAQQSLADAERQAQAATQSSADAIVAAQQRVEAAAYSLTQAQQTETRAEQAQLAATQALTQAKQDAANTLADVNNAAADSHLAVEQATINAANAQKNLNIVNATGTADQKKLADLQARQAVQALADAKQRDLEATQKANQANKEGVDHLPAVVSAQHAVAQAADATANAQHGATQALQGQADAGHALAVAQQNAANQQITSAEQVAKAQAGVAAAVKGAADQQIASAQAVQRAEQSLSDTRTQQGLAAAAAASAAGSASNKFATDMTKNSQPVRDMVNQLLSMKGGFDKLKLTAQTATLPGFTQMLKDTGPLLPIINTGVETMGHTLSNTALQFGNLFQDQKFQASLTQFTALANQGFSQFASALAPLFAAIVDSTVKAAPIINNLTQGIHDLMATGLPAFLSGLTVNAPGAAQGLDAIFKSVNDLLGPVGTLVGAFSGALGPALANLEPAVKILADDILNALMPVMPALSDALLAAVGAFDQLVPIIEPLIPLLADSLTSGLKAATPLLKDMAGFLHDNADWLGPVAEGILGLVAATKGWGAITGIAEAGTTVFKSSMKLFGKEAEGAEKNTKGVGSAIGGFASKLGSALPIIGMAVPLVASLGDKIGKMSGVGDHTALNIDNLTQALNAAAHGSEDAQTKIDHLAGGLAFMNDHVGVNTQGLKDLDGALAGLRATDPAAAASEFDKLSASLQANGMNADQVTKLFPQYKAALDGVKDTTKAAAAEATNAHQPFSGLALRLDSVGLAGKNTADDLKRLDGQLHAIDLNLANKQALDDYTTALNGIKDGAKGSTREISGNSQAALDNRGQLDQAIQSLRHYYDSQVALHGPTDQVNQDFQTQIDKLRTQAERTYGSKQAVDDYMTSLGLVPASKTTKVDVNVQDGVKTIATWQKEIDTLHGPHIDLTIERILGPGNVQISFAGSKIKASTNADGGPVRAGEVSWVGERGPELVQFDRPGKVISNEQIRRVGPSAVMSAPAAKPSITNNFIYNGTQQPSIEQQADMMRRLALAVAA